MPQTLADRLKPVDQYEEELAKRLGIPVYIYKALTKWESRNRQTEPTGETVEGPKTRKGDTALGKYQVTGEQSRRLGKNVHDPHENINAGLTTLKHGYDEAAKHYKTEGERWAAALTEYHGGRKALEGTVKRGGEIKGDDQYKHTSRYVQDIMQEAERLYRVGAGEPTPPPQKRQPAPPRGEQQAPERPLPHQKPAARQPYIAPEGEEQEFAGKPRPKGIPKMEPAPRKSALESLGARTPPLTPLEIMQKRIRGEQVFLDDVGATSRELGGGIRRQTPEEVEKRRTKAMKVQPERGEQIDKALQEMSPEEWQNLMLAMSEGQSGVAARAGKGLQLPPGSAVEKERQRRYRAQSVPSTPEERQAAWDQPRIGQTRLQEYVGRRGEQQRLRGIEVETHRRKPPTYKVDLGKGVEEREYPAWLVKGTRPELDATNLLKNLQAGVGQTQTQVQTALRQGRDILGGLQAGTVVQEMKYAPANERISEVQKVTEANIAAHAAYEKQIAKLEAQMALQSEADPDLGGQVQRGLGQAGSQIAVLAPAALTGGLVAGPVGAMGASMLGMGALGDWEKDPWGAAIEAGTMPLDILAGGVAGRGVSAALRRTVSPLLRKAAATTAAVGAGMGTEFTQETASQVIPKILEGKPIDPDMAQQVLAASIVGGLLGPMGGIDETTPPQIRLPKFKMPTVTIPGGKGDPGAAGAPPPAGTPPPTTPPATPGAWTEERYGVPTKFTGYPRIPTPEQTQRRYGQHPGRPAATLPQDPANTVVPQLQAMSHEQLLNEFEKEQNPLMARYLFGEGQRRGQAFEDYKKATYDLRKSQADEVEARAKAAEPPAPPLKPPAFMRPANQLDPEDVAELSDTALAKVRLNELSDDALIAFSKRERLLSPEKRIELLGEVFSREGLSERMEKEGGKGWAVTDPEKPAGELSEYGRGSLRFLATTSGTATISRQAFDELEDAVPHLFTDANAKVTPAGAQTVEVRLTEEGRKVATRLSAKRPEQIGSMERRHLNEIRAGHRVKASYKQYQEMKRAVPELFTKEHATVETRPGERDVFIALTTEGQQFYDDWMEGKEDYGAADKEEGLYRKAVEFATGVGGTSAYSLQMHLGIGLGRAQDIFDRMDREGLLGAVEKGGSRAMAKVKPLFDKPLEEMTNDELLELSNERGIGEKKGPLILAEMASRPDFPWDRVGEGEQPTDREKTLKVNEELRAAEEARDKAKEKELKESGKVKPPKERKPARGTLFHTFLSEHPLMARHNAKMEEIRVRRAAAQEDRAKAWAAGDETASRHAAKEVEDIDAEYRAAQEGGVAESIERRIKAEWEKENPDEPRYTETYADRQAKQAAGTAKRNLEFREKQVQEVKDEIQAVHDDKQITKEHKRELLSGLGDRLDTAKRNLEDAQTAELSATTNIREEAPNRFTKSTKVEHLSDFRFLANNIRDIDYDLETYGGIRERWVDSTRKTAEAVLKGGEQVLAERTLDPASERALKGAMGRAQRVLDQTKPSTRDGSAPASSVLKIDPGKDPLLTARQAHGAEALPGESESITRVRKRGSQAVADWVAGKTETYQPETPAETEKETKAEKADEVRPEKGWGNIPRYMGSDVQYGEGENDVGSFLLDDDVRKALGLKPLPDWVIWKDAAAQGGIDPSSEADRKAASAGIKESHWNLSKALDVPTLTEVAPSRYREWMREQGWNEDSTPWKKFEATVREAGGAPPIQRSRPGRGRNVNAERAARALSPEAEVQKAEKEAEKISPRAISRMTFDDKGFPADEDSKITARQIASLAPPGPDALLMPNGELTEEGRKHVRRVVAANAFSDGHPHSADLIGALVTRRQQVAGEEHLYLPTAVRDVVLKNLGRIAALSTRSRRAFQDLRDALLATLNKKYTGALAGPAEALRRTLETYKSYERIGALQKFLSGYLGIVEAAQPNASNRVLVDMAIEEFEDGQRQEQKTGGVSEGTGRGQVSEGEGRGAEGERGGPTAEADKGAKGGTVQPTQADQTKAKEGEGEPSRADTLTRIEEIPGIAGESLRKMAQNPEPKSELKAHEQVAIAYNQDEETRRLYRRVADWDVLGLTPQQFDAAVGALIQKFAEHGVHTKGLQAFLYDSEPPKGSRYRAWIKSGHPRPFWQSTLPPNLSWENIVDPAKRPFQLTQWRASHHARMALDQNSTILDLFRIAQFHVIDQMEGHGSHTVEIDPVMMNLMAMIQGNGPFAGLLLDLKDNYPLKVRTLQLAETLEINHDQSVIDAAALGQTFRARPEDSLDFANFLRWAVQRNEPVQFYVTDATDPNWAGSQREQYFWERVIPHEGIHLGFASTTGSPAPYRGEWLKLQPEHDELVRIYKKITPSAESMYTEGEMLTYLSTGEWGRWDLTEDQATNLLMRFFKDIVRRYGDGVFDDIMIRPPYMERLITQAKEEVRSEGSYGYYPGGQLGPIAAPGPSVFANQPGGTAPGSAQGPQGAAGPTGTPSGFPLTDREGAGRLQNTGREGDRKGSQKLGEEQKKDWPKGWQVAEYSPGKPFSRLFEPTKWKSSRDTRRSLTLVPVRSMLPDMAAAAEFRLLDHMSQPGKYYSFEVDPVLMAMLDTLSETSRQASALVMNFKKQPHYAAYRAHQLGELYSKAQQEAKAAGKPLRHHAHDLSKFADLLRKAGKEGAVVQLFKTDKAEPLWNLMEGHFWGRTVLHESVHLGMAIATIDSAPFGGDWVYNQKEFGEWRKRYRETILQGGMRPVDSREVESELLAYISSGDHKRVGFTEEEATDFLTRFYTDIVRRYGDTVFDDILYKKPEAELLMERAKETVRKEGSSGYYPTGPQGPIRGMQKVSASRPTGISEKEDWGGGHYDDPSQEINTGTPGNRPFRLARWKKTGDEVMVASASAGDIVRGAEFKIMDELSIPGKVLTIEVHPATMTILDMMVNTEPAAGRVYDTINNAAAVYRYGQMLEHVAGQQNVQFATGNLMHLGAVFKDAAQHNVPIQVFMTDAGDFQWRQYYEDDFWDQTLPHELMHLGVLSATGGLAPFEGDWIRAQPEYFEWETRFLADVGSHVPPGPLRDQEMEAELMTYLSTGGHARWGFDQTEAKEIMRRMYKDLVRRYGDGVFDAIMVITDFARDIMADARAEVGRERFEGLYGGQDASTPQGPTGVPSSTGGPSSAPQKAKGGVPRDRGKGDRQSARSVVPERGMEGAYREERIKDAEGKLRTLIPSSPFLEVLDKAVLRHANYFGQRGTPGSPPAGGGPPGPPAPPPGPGPAPAPGGRGPRRRRLPVAPKPPTTVGGQLQEIGNLIQIFNHLGHAQFFWRNLEQAFLVNPALRGIEDIVEATLDKMTHGKRPRSFVAPTPGEHVRAAKRGVKEAIKEFQQGRKAGATRSWLGSRPTPPISSLPVFAMKAKNPVIRAAQLAAEKTLVSMEVSLDVINALPDDVSKEYNSAATMLSLYRMMRKANPGMTPAERKVAFRLVASEAAESGKFWSFRFANIPSKLIGGAKLALNALSFGLNPFNWPTIRNAKSISGFLRQVEHGTRLGLGDVMSGVKYHTIPGGIISQTLQGQPFFAAGAFVHHGYNYHKAKLKGDDAGMAHFKRKMIQSATRGLITGPAFMGMGAVAYMLGMVEEDMDDNESVQRTQRETGHRPFAFNVSKLWRFLSGGMDFRGYWATDDKRAQDGDILVDINFLQPIATWLAMGAAMAHVNHKDPKLSWDNWAKQLAWKIPKQTFAAAADTLLENTFGERYLTDVGNAWTYSRKRGWGHFFEHLGQSVAENAPVQFMPIVGATQLYHIRQIFDPYSREARVERQAGLKVTDPEQKWLKTLKTGVWEYPKSRIPGVSKSQPVARTAWGKEREITPGWAEAGKGVRALSVFAPFKWTRVREEPVQREAIALGVAPGLPTLRKGETQEMRRERTRIRGEYIIREGNALVEHPDWKGADKAQKKAWLRQLYRVAGSEAANALGIEDVPGPEDEP